MLPVSKNAMKVVRTSSRQSDHVVDGLLSLTLTVFPDNFLVAVLTIFTLYSFSFS